MEFHLIKLALLCDSEVLPEARSSPEQLCQLYSVCFLQVLLPLFHIHSPTQANIYMGSTMNDICQMTR